MSAPRAPSAAPAGRAYGTSKACFIALSPSRPSAALLALLCSVLTPLGFTPSSLFPLALPQATLLVNVSEDSWFGDSLAPHQRLQMARMRALEAGRPMLRAANNGPSVFIDHRGAVRARSPQFASYTLTGMVQPTAGATPYVKYGNAPVVALVLILLAGARALVLRTKSLAGSTRRPDETKI